MLHFRFSMKATFLCVNKRLNHCVKFFCSSGGIKQITNGSRFKVTNGHRLQLKNNEQNGSSTEAIKKLRTLKGQNVRLENVLLPTFEKATNEHYIPNELISDDKPKPADTHMNLLSQLTTEFSKLLTYGSTCKNLRMKTLRELLSLMGGLGYPFPDALSVHQWSQLVTYDGKEAMLLYFDAILDGNCEDQTVLEEIRAIDERLSSALAVPPNLEEEIGKNPELRERFSMYCKCFEILQNNAEYVNPFPDKHEFMHILECQKEEEMFLAFNYFAKAHQEKLESQINAKIAQYQESKNSGIFLGEDPVRDNYNNVRLARAMCHDWNPSLIVDLDFADKMLFKEIGSFFNKYLPALVMHNRESPEPFKLHLTNYRPNTMEKLSPDLKQGLTPVNITEKCYLDLFPRERLVYLSPDSTYDLKYDPDDVYIIGGIVDNFRKNSWSLKKANAQGIRHAKFPFSSILGMECVLPVHYATGVLLDFCRTRDWFYACRWVDPEVFRLVLRNPHTAKQEFVYLIQKKLHPGSFDTYNGRLNPKKYKAAYSEFMRFAPNDETLINSKKYAKGGLDKANLMEFTKKYSKSMY